MTTSDILVGDLEISPRGFFETWDSLGLDMDGMGMFLAKRPNRRGAMFWNLRRRRLGPTEITASKEQASCAERRAAADPVVLGSLREQGVRTRDLSRSSAVKTVKSER